MKKLALALLLLAGSAQAAPVCAKFTPQNRGLGLQNTPLPADPNAPLSVEQALAFYNDYFDAWYEAAFLAELVRPAPLPASVYDRVMGFYAKDVAVIAKDTGVAQWPDIVIPAVPDLARTAFFDAFLYKQPGNVHRPDYLCVDGNTVSVGFHYFAPYPGRFLSQWNPEPGDAAVTAPVVERATISGGQIRSMVFYYDFFWFLSESAKAGIPMN